MYIALLISSSTAIALNWSKPRNVEVEIPLRFAPPDLLSSDADPTVLTLITANSCRKQSPKIIADWLIKNVVDCPKSASFNRRSIHDWSPAVIHQTLEEEMARPPTDQSFTKGDFLHGMLNQETFQFHQANLR